MAFRAHTANQVKPPKWLLDSCVTNQSGRLQTAGLEQGPQQPGLGAPASQPARRPRHPDANVLRGLRAVNGEARGQTAYSEETHSLRPKAADENFLKKPLYRSPSQGSQRIHICLAGPSRSAAPTPAPFSRSLDRSSRKPRAGPFRLPLQRHFPLFKGEKNSPSAVSEEPSEVDFVISSRAEAPEGDVSMSDWHSGPGLFA